jgi:hypothetical protein
VPAPAGESALLTDRRRRRRLLGRVGSHHTTCLSAWQGRRMRPERLGIRRRRHPRNAGTSGQHGDPPEPCGQAGSTGIRTGAGSARALGTHLNRVGWPTKSMWAGTPGVGIASPGGHWDRRHMQAGRQAGSFRRPNHAISVTDWMASCTTLTWTAGCGTMGGEWSRGPLAAPRQ